MIEYYGTPTPLSQLAGIQNPEARSILITPYDKAGAQWPQTGRGGLPGMRVARWCDDGAI